MLGNMDRYKEEGVGQKGFEGEWIVEGQNRWTEGWMPGWIGKHTDDDRG